jgi:lipopolysaccharide export system protein LptC
VKRRLLLLLALVALGFLVFKLTGDDTGLAGDTTRAAQQTGYYLRDATVTEYGVDGKVRLEVAVRSATEDPARKVVDLEAVAVNYFPDGDRKWRLTAQRGQMAEGSEVVELEGDVTMTGAQRSLPDSAVVRTERLTLDTSAQLARTDEPVTLGFGPYTLAARGLHADLKAETLQLESEVNGHFNP